MSWDHTSQPSWSTERDRDQRPASPPAAAAVSQSWRVQVEDYHSLLLCLAAAAVLAAALLRAKNWNCFTFVQFAALSFSFPSSFNGNFCSCWFYTALIFFNWAVAVAILCFFFIDSLWAVNAEKVCCAPDDTDERTWVSLILCDLNCPTTVSWISR